MKKKQLYMLPIVLGVFLAICAVIRMLIPMAVLPKLDIPNMVLLSLIALVLEHYFTVKRGNNLIVTLVLSAFTFGLLPYVSGFAAGIHILLLAALGGIVFTLTAWLYASVQERLSTGPVAKAAPVFSALGLYLAAQCFSGIIL